MLIDRNTIDVCKIQSRDVILVRAILPIFVAKVNPLFQNITDTIIMSYKSDSRNWQLDIAL